MAEALPLDGKVTCRPHIAVHRGHFSQMPGLLSLLDIFPEIMCNLTCTRLLPEHICSVVQPPCPDAVTD